MRVAWPASPARPWAPRRARRRRGLAPRGVGGHAGAVRRGPRGGRATRVQRLRQDVAVPVVAAGPEPIAERLPAGGRRRAAVQPPADGRGRAGSLVPVPGPMPAGARRVPDGLEQERGWVRRSARARVAGVPGAQLEPSDRLVERTCAVSVRAPWLDVAPVRVVVAPGRRAEGDRGRAVGGCGASIATGELLRRTRRRQQRHCSCFPRFVHPPQRNSLTRNTPKAG